MISGLELLNYRGFKQYKLSGLKRVNLLVGGNNSGKTSILEAVNLLASGGDIGVLARIARERGEVVYDSNEQAVRHPGYPVISHFFHGHEIEPGSSFRLLTVAQDHEIELSIQRHVAGDGNVPAKPFDQGLSNFFMALKIGGKAYSSNHLAPLVPISVEGAILLETFPQFAQLGKRKIDEGPVLFVSSDSLDRSALSEMWDEVVTADREKEVENAMRIVEPKFKDVRFLSGERTLRFQKSGGIVVGIEGEQRRRPLGTYGEGMRRMLALSLALANARNGTLLIDEIDTGFQYSIMGDVWLLIAEAAQRYNIQVFATTHSFDCIRGLEWLCLRHPELGEEVSLQKIEPTLDEAVSHNAREIRIVVEQEIEVR